MQPSYESISRRNFVYIPEEILVEILKRLPAKSLLRCMCVHKSWHHLIQTPMFVKLHSNHQNLTPTHNPKHLLFTATFSELLLRYDDEQCQESQLKLEYPPDMNFKNRKTITSAGLICLYDIDNIYLYNPYIRKYKSLPHLPTLPSGSVLNSRYCPRLAFGYVPQINDYRVVKIFNYTNEYEVRSFMTCVYSLSTNSWKTKIIQDKFFIHMPWYRLFFNGAAFWTGYTMGSVKIILHFDTINDILQTIEFPAEVLSCKPFYPSSLALHQLGQSIAYFVVDPRSTVLNMWVLKQGSLNEFFWGKKICASLNEKEYFRVLGSRNNNELVISRKRKRDLISYNVEKDEVNDFVHSWHRWFPARIVVDKEEELYNELLSVSPFSESLVLLDSV